MRVWGNGLICYSGNNISPNLSGLQYSNIVCLLILYLYLLGSYLKEIIRQVLKQYIYKDVHCIIVYNIKGWKNLSVHH